MRRFTVALFLSFILHAALLALLQESRIELAPREIIRITLAELPGENGDGRDDPISHEATPEPEQPPQPIERTVAAEPTPAPVPAPQPAPVPTPAPTPRPAPTPAPPPTPQTVPVPVPAPTESGSAQQDSVQQGNAQQNSAREAAQVSPPVSGRSGGRDTVIDASLLRVTRRVTAEYPMISRRRRDQGTVVLILSIQSGRVTRVEVERSSGHPALDESARRAVSAWEFDTSGFGEFVSARIPFVFSLTN